MQVLSATGRLTVVPLAVTAVGTTLLLVAVGLLRSRAPGTGHGQPKE
jgi:hypothetical protein